MGRTEQWKSRSIKLSLQIPSTVSLVLLTAVHHLEKTVPKNPKSLCASIPLEVLQHQYSRCLSFTSSNISQTFLITSSHGSRKLVWTILQCLVLPFFSQPHPFTQWWAQNAACSSEQWAVLALFTGITMHHRGVCYCAYSGHIVKIASEMACASAGVNL